MNTHAFSASSRPPANVAWWLVIIGFTIMVSGCQKQPGVTDVPDLIAAGELTTAELVLVEATNEAPQDWEAWWRLAQFYREHGSYKQAMDALDEALAVMPEGNTVSRVELLDHRLAWAREAGRWTVVLSSTDRLTPLVPERQWELLETRFEAFYAQGDLESCLDVVRAMQELDGRTADALYYRAKSFMGEGDVENSLDSALRSLASLSETATPPFRTYLLIARLYRAKGDFAEALGFYGNFFVFAGLQPVDNAPNFAADGARPEPELIEQAWIGRGDVLVRMKQDREAEEAYRSAVKVAPESWAGAYSLASLYARSGNGAAAAEWLEYAAKRGFVDVWQVETESMWKPVRSHPDVQQVLAAIKAQQQTIDLINID